MIEQDMALTNEKPLQSWKEIAAYLERDERTARRWEKEEGLPVRRHRQDGRGTVYAYASELDAWRLARKPRAVEAEADAEGARGARWPKWLAPAAACLALVAALLAVRYGPILNPPRPLVEAAGEILTAKLLWSGAEVDGTAAPTPDGRFVAGTDWKTGDLNLRELSTGNVRRLVAGNKEGASNHTRAFSHDGKWLAYDWGKAGARSLRLLNMGDGTSRTIWDKPGSRGVDVWGWTPDDSAVLVTLYLDKVGPERSVVALVGVDGGERRVMAAGDKGMVGAALSPDGQWVAYDHRQDGKAGFRDISVVSVDGATEYAMVRHPAHEVLMGWGKGGLLFTSDRRGATDLYLLPMYAGRGAGDAVTVRRDIGAMYPIHFDGRGAYYYSSRANTAEGYVAGFDAAAGRLTGEARAASPEYFGAQSSVEWSPDGKRLAIVVRKKWPSNVEGAMGLRIREVATGQEREIPLDLSWVEFPSWAPDGNSILLTARDEQHRGIAAIVRVSDGTVRRIAATGEDEIQKGVWSRDGRSLLLVRSMAASNKTVLVQRDVAGRSEKVVHEIAAGRALVNLDAAPDGESIVYNLTQVGEAGTQVMVASLSGGAARQVATAPGMIPVQCLQWSKGDGRIYYSVGGRSVWRVAPGVGAPEQVAISREGLRRVRVSPDGKAVAFVAGKLGTELWSLEWSGAGGAGQ